MIAVSLRRLALALAFAAGIVGVAYAQQPPAPAAPPAEPTPVEEFSKQVESLKKSFTDLDQKIQNSAKAIDGLGDVETMRKEIEALRAIVSGALGSVSDNGAVAKLGDKALSHAREKLKQLERDTRFTAEQRQFLLGEWRRIESETDRAAEDLAGARREFTQLLRILQTREDFIEELLQVRRANEAIDVIRQLAREIRGASESLKNLIRAIKPPGS